MAQQFNTISHGRLWIETCCKCKVPFAMDDETYTTMVRLAEKGSFNCPLGHPQHYTSGESEFDKMRRDRDRLAQRVAERDDEINRQREARKHAERSAIAYKGKVTRLKNRASVGLCPCCNRSFQDLARHMAGKHPEFVTADHAAEAAE